MIPSPKNKGGGIIGSQTCGKPDCKLVLRLGEDAMECRGCKVVFHPNCTKFNNVVVNFLKEHKILNDIIWCCDTCKPIVDKSISTITEIEKKVNIMDTGLKELEIKTNRNEIENIKMLTLSNILEQRIENLETKLDNKVNKVEEEIINKEQKFKQIIDRKVLTLSNAFEQRIENLETKLDNKVNKVEEEIINKEQKFKQIIDRKVLTLSNAFEQKIENLETKLENKVSIVGKEILNKEQEFKKIINRKIPDTSKNTKQNSENVTKLDNNIITLEEKTDREKRSKNLIFYNVPESNLMNPQDRIKDDCKNLKDIFERNNFSLKAENIINVIRLGKYDSISPKARPILLKMNSTEYKFTVLKNCKNLKFLKDNLSISIHYSLDLTIKERENRKVLVQQLQDRRNNGENNLAIIGNKITTKKEDTQTGKNMKISWASLVREVFLN